MLLNSEQLLKDAERARRLACGLTNLKDVRDLLGYANECEMAAILENLGQLRFEDQPMHPGGAEWAVLAV